MRHTLAPVGSPRLRWVGLAAVCWAAAAAPAGFAQQPADDKPADDKPAAPTGRPLTLAECLAMALENLPNIKAARQSVAAAEAGCRALANIHQLSTVLSPDVPVRREQAARGLTVAAAGLEQVRVETTYDVSFLYYSYVFARQGEATAADLVAQLTGYYRVAEDAVKLGLGGKKVNQFTLYGIQNVIGRARLARVRAQTGQRRALEGLREAMAVDPGFEFHPATAELPLLSGTVTREQVVGLALARRPELAQAAAGVDAFRLEVAAQGLVRFRQQVSTLADGTDLHSRPVPLAQRSGTGTAYQPGAVPPEMPSKLVGRREDRVARAAALSARQDAVYEAAVNLVRLDAANAFVEWEAAGQRVAETRRTYETARRLVDQSRQALEAGRDPDLLIGNEALAGQAQGDYLQAVFEQVQAVANLDRVTAGGLRPEYAGAAAVPTAPQPAPAKDKDKDK